MRDGITTGSEWACMAAAGLIVLGAAAGSDGTLILGIGFSAGFTVGGGSGFLAVRVPIFSVLLRCNGGDCCRYGKDLGEYMILEVGPDGVHLVTNGWWTRGTARRL
jgi:hypothetical protein